MLDVRGLTKSFGPIRAVDDVSFALRQGEVLGFLGPNGAGKTTSMKMITGFLRPDAGAVSICGIDLAAQPAAAKACFGYLPEGAPAWPDMTPLSFLQFAARLRGVEPAAVERALVLASLVAVADQPIDTLSKGFRRRVGLAQAILHDPPILILDEPTDGLDPNQKLDVRRLIRTMAPGKAILISTHILEEVDAVCNRAIIIERGRIVADGAPAELAARAGSLEALFRSLTRAEVVP